MGTGTGWIAASSSGFQESRSQSRRGAGESHRQTTAPAGGSLRACGTRPCGGSVRSVVSRMARLEQFSRLSTGPRRIRIECGYLKKLPDDYIGPRHTVTVRRLPPGPGAYSRDDWYEWEERPGVSRHQTLPAPPTRSWSKFTTLRGNRRAESTHWLAPIRFDQAAALDAIAHTEVCRIPGKQPAQIWPVDPYPGGPEDGCE
jgi:hypothetical protein